ncbi:hypothetical protein [Xenorhabdus bharatensis]|uniref:hypothetical protein n=1 Tax=Xenorhabdus bharatensis TaxID=3136256 RepID=UPI0030F4873A
MSTNYDSKLIVGTELENVSISDEEIEDLVCEGYARHGSYFSGEFYFIGKEIHTATITSENFDEEYLSLKDEVAKALGVDIDDVSLRNGVLIW